MFWPGVGEVIIVETIFEVEGISPMTIPLQEPPLTWRPFVNVFPLQKLMKLAGSVRDSA